MKNPWVGLRPFKVSESKLFFGRAREVQILSNLVATLPTLIVYAPSGTGKSSLINAGLVPLLDKDPTQVPVFLVDPHDDALTRTQATLTESGWHPPTGLDLAGLLERHWLDTDHRTILIVDQFEERVNAGAPIEELFGTMAALAQSHADAACILISIREDYLGSLEPLMRRVPGLLNGSYRIPALSRVALEEAVYGPLREVDDAASVEKSLVSRTLDDLNERSSGRQEPGEQRFEPGYFQIVWSSLWNERVGTRASTLDLKTYQRLGGVSRILKDFTSKILNGLEPAQTAVFWAISRYLVLPTGAKAALTVEDLVSLVRPSDFPAIDTGSYRSSGQWLTQLSQSDLARLIRSVLQRLTASDAPIFQRVMRLDREEFELLHDLLGQIILGWREEYVRSQQKLAKDLVRSVKTAAESQGWGVRSLTRRSSESYMRTINDAIREAKEFDKLLGESLSAVNLVSVVDQSRRMLVLRAVLDDLHGHENYRLRGRFTSHLSSATARMVRLALDHNDEAVRRQLQDILIHFDYRASARINDPTPWLTLLSRLIIVAVPATGSLVASYFLFRSTINDLDIEYVFLTLSHLLVVLLFLYTFLYEAKAREKNSVVQLAVPFLINRKARLSLLLTWPLPALWIQGGAVCTALVFNWLTWAATAGYNVGMLFATVIFLVMTFTVAQL